ncbi:hypothetical protein ANANG_G00051850 [Anguilla anguilla]|uniref:ZP domain-containing protein n=2 Tax=Anguilla anguilla TaxID=7936 RepID=A0A9D3MZ38_ANGAN|nr:hypothetical protein ANANG_G00051850 [Anguilla anguilla]
MIVAIFCVCLLNYASFSATERPETENAWEDHFPSEADLKIAPEQKSNHAAISDYKLPLYVHGDDSAAVAKQKQWFHYNNRGPLPQEAKDVMLPTTILPPAPPKPSFPMVDALCHMDRIYVRILKNAVNDTRAWRHLYFGNCRVNAARGLHYYFLYPITSCGLKPQVLNDSIVFTNLVRYLRKFTTQSNITRTPTLTVPVTCKYPRYHRTYDVGIHPILGRNYTMSPPTRGSMVLVVLDANWAPLGTGAHFKLGEGMHFEVRAGGGQRVFANRCWITPSDKPSTTLLFTPIKNYGCMVDSVNSSLSHYHAPTDLSTLRFVIEAFVFPSMPAEQALSVYCEVTVAATATFYRKACTYDRTSDMWHELDRRNDALCLCCKSVCPDPPSTATPANKVSTEPFLSWDTSAGSQDHATSWPENGIQYEPNFNGNFPQEWAEEP